MRLLKRITGYALVLSPFAVVMAGGLYAVGPFIFVAFGVGFAIVGAIFGGLILIESGSRH